MADFNFNPLSYIKSGKAVDSDSEDEDEDVLSGSDEEDEEEVVSGSDDEEVESGDEEGDVDAKQFASIFPGIAKAEEEEVDYEDDDESGEEISELDEDEELEYAKKINIGNIFTTSGFTSLPPPPPPTMVSGQPAPIVMGTSKPSPMFTTGISSFSSPSSYIPPVTMPTSIAFDTSSIPFASQSPFSLPVIQGITLTGDINKDLVKGVNENQYEFETRSKITRTVNGPPYNLNVKEALIIGRLWCLKALYGNTFSKEIEAELERVKQRAG